MSDAQVLLKFLSQKETADGVNEKDMHGKILKQKGKSR